MIYVSEIYHWEEFPPEDAHVGTNVHELGDLTPHGAYTLSRAGFIDARCISRRTFQLAGGYLGRQLRYDYSNFITPSHLISHK